MQTILAGVVIVSAVAVAWHSKADATITGFLVLGVALGYVLGGRPANEDTRETLTVSLGRVEGDRD